MKNPRFKTSISTDILRVNNNLILENAKKKVNRIEERIDESRKRFEETKKGSSI